MPWAVNLAAVVLKPSQVFNSLVPGLRAHDKELTETSKYAHLGTLVVEGMAEGKLTIWSALRTLTPLMIRTPSDTQLNSWSCS